MSLDDIRELLIPRSLLGPYQVLEKSPHCLSDRGSEDAEHACLFWLSVARTAVLAGRRRASLPRAAERRLHTSPALIQG